MIINTNPTIVPEISDLFDGLKIVSSETEILYVFQTPDGFQIRYLSGFGEVGYDTGIVSMEHGIVKSSFGIVHPTNPPNQ